MTEQPVMIDLYCGAGGAAKGYADAGFRVIGVDKEPQPNYPYEFVRADALTFPLDGAAAAHASPVCKRHTRGAAQHGTTDRHPNQIGPTRERLQAAGIPYVIENVELARPHLRNPIMLCGQMFGLGVFRHRFFELGGFAMPRPQHPRHDGRVGDGRYVTVTGHPGGSSRRDGIKMGSLADWRRAMGIDWTTSRELAQAIPPAYTAYIAPHLLAEVRRRQALANATPEQVARLYAPTPPAPQPDTYAAEVRHLAELDAEQLDECDGDGFRPGDLVTVESLRHAFPGEQYEVREIDGTEALLEPCDGTPGTDALLVPLTLLAHA